MAKNNFEMGFFQTHGHPVINFGQSVAIVGSFPTIQTLLVRPHGMRKKFEVDVNDVFTSERCSTGAYNIS